MAMPFRRTFTAPALAFALSGTMPPVGHTDAQIGAPAVQPSDTDRHPPDVAWLDLLGLFGLFGSKRADRTMR
jgi:hypothetical protein